MAARPGYLIKESFSNLRRNVLMTVTAIITITVSLTIVGSALLIRQCTNNAAQQFRDGIELSIFMKSDATQTQLDATRNTLESLKTNGSVKRFFYMDKKASQEEIEIVLANSPDSLDVFDDLANVPTSFRVVPTEAESIAALGQRFKDREGVLEIQDDSDIKRVLKFVGIIQVVLLSIAVSLLVAAVLLILNTIQLAIFSRRREVAVMKLVGGTNWFIRLPFMLEGLLQGLLGGVLAFALVFLGTDRSQSAIRSSTSSWLQTFSVTSGQVWSTGIFMILVGAAVGAIGSAIAVSRFLDV